MFCLDAYYANKIFLVNNIEVLHKSRIYYCDDKSNIIYTENSNNKRAVWIGEKI